MAYIKPKMNVFFANGGQAVQAVSRQNFFSQVLGKTIQRQENRQNSEETKVNAIRMLSGNSFS